MVSSVVPRKSALFDGLGALRQPNLLKSVGFIWKKQLNQVANALSAFFKIEWSFLNF